MSKEKKNLYTVDSIVTETPREFTRRVPSTYLGSSRTNTNLIKEIFANAVDEAAIGHGDVIDVNIDTKKNIYIVEDHGQGFLVNAGIDDDGETILQRSFDKLNTSGKTSADGVYEGTALGLNGIGAKLTNWLSKKLNVKTYRDGEFEEIDFEDGIFKNRKTGKTRHESGTVVTWNPDPQFFAQNLPDVAMLQNHFDIVAALCPNLTINFTYDGQTTIYHEPGGIDSYVNKKVKGKELFSERFVTERSVTVNTYYNEKHNISLKETDFNKKGEYVYQVQERFMEDQPGQEFVIKKSDCILKPRTEKLNICITYTSDYSETIDAYVNLGHTDAGAHIGAIHTSLVKTVNKFATDTGLLKKNDKNFNNAEISEGLYIVCNITTTTAKYDAQNKSRIDDIDATIITSVIGGDFATWLTKNPADAKIITERALTARKAREAAQKAKEKIREASNGKGAKTMFADLPSKLADAYPKDKKDRSQCEIYIVEGDSAGTAIKAVKKSTFQACFPVRGKVLCCQKATKDKVYANAEIANLVKASGLDIDPKSGKLIYDPKKLRYNKWIIATDADADGDDIALLLICAIYWLCPELIINGHLYRVYGALFKATFNDGTYLTFQTDAEFEKWKKTNKKPYKLSRAKGLGELTEEETYEQLINPATRDLARLTVKNVEDLEYYLELFLGKEVPPRFAYLEEHYNDYIDEEE